jgi:tRNA(Leu) C34 or U34 (ribose-2'-O)-methylase TrmL
VNLFGNPYRVISTTYSGESGNIAARGADSVSLHLVRPLGFSTDDKMLKRAGLDYWEHVDIHYHDRA